MSGMDAEAVQQAWVDRTGAYSPDYYAHYGSNESSHRLREQLDRRIGADGSVLELGCSAGRHLAHLYEHGYRDLWGVDINAESGTVMRQAYPALAAAGNFTFEAIEDVIASFDARQFDAVFSVETLQHIHHDHEWVFEEVARVTDRLLVTMEIEDTDNGAPEQAVKYIDDDFPLYRRDWGSVFTSLGFEQVQSRPVGRDRMRVFRRPTPETPPPDR